MSDRLPNDSWVDALRFYDTLSGLPQWSHIARFRSLVSTLARSREARGLTAVTSHEVLLVSPYTKHPDWFDGRHVRLIPLPDGHVQIARYRAGGQPGSPGVLTIAIDEAIPSVLQAIGEL